MPATLIQRLKLDRIQVGIVAQRSPILHANTILSKSAEMVIFQISTCEAVLGVRMDGLLRLPSGRFGLVESDGWATTMRENFGTSTFDYHAGSTRTRWRKSADWISVSSAA